MFMEGREVWGGGVGGGGSRTARKRSTRQRQQEWLWVETLERLKSKSRAHPVPVLALVPVNAQQGTMKRVSARIPVSGPVMISVPAIVRGAACLSGVKKRI